MALSTEMESLLTELEKVDPAGAKEQRAILDKFPKLQDGLKGGVMRQSDYDRNMNASKDKLAEAEKWQRWAKDNIPIHTQLQKDYAAKEAELERQNAEVERLKSEVEAKSIAAAAAAGGNAGDAEKITAAVKAAIKDAGGMPTKAELAELIRGATDEQMKEARKDFYEKEIPRNLAFVTSMTNAQNRYFRETGKDLDTAEFSKFMVDNNITDPAKAYDRFMEPTNRKKEIETEAQKLADEKVDKWKRENGASGIPGSSGSQGLGHLQIRVTEKKAGDPLFSQDVELGDNTAAMAAAAELRSENKVA
jgi:hypothetical protein